MAGEGQNLMAAGQQYNLDARLLVSLAGAETRSGAVQTRGAFNAWNWLWNAKHPSQSSFTSYAAGEMRVASGLVRLYGLPSTNFGSGYLQKYCTTGTTCTNGLSNMQSFMSAQGGNFNSLAFPCKKPN